MPGQQWTQAALGGVMTSETLSRTYRLQAQRKYRWRQLCRVDLALGCNNGDFYTFVKGDDLQDEGQTLGEFDPVPETQAEDRKGQVMVEERSNSVPYTHRLSLLAKLSAEDTYITRLKNNMAKTLDRMCGASFRDSDVVYTPQGAATNPFGAVVNNGTPALLASREFIYEDFKNIVDLMRGQEYLMPTWENDGYIAVASITASRTLKDDNELVEIFKYADASRLLNGEIGKIYGQNRVIEENHLLDGNMSNGCGEVVFVAWDAVVEAMAYAEEIQ